MNSNFWSGFEKTALNAAKARALAAKYSLIPEGSWKWALRNLRKGKTREHLGQAPKAVVDQVKKKGKKVEVGRFWGKGSRGRSRLYTGSETGVDLGGEGKTLARNKEFMAAAFSEPGQRDALKAQGKITNLYKKHLEKTKGLNTIHSHPGGHTGGDIMQMERDMVRVSRNPDDETKHIIQDVLKRHPLGHRLQKIHSRNNSLMADAIEQRYNSKHPPLMPSGFKTKSPYNLQGADRQRFLLGDVGTHHNIVSPGTGVGIHTVRPNKATGDKQLRSILFKEGKR